ncbi:MAG: hypothetical protein D6772_13910 [Bacteroidetes bacterium]|nr:MAG: hypothetical protein D6772_13910 [Bacteroidota bacterium]
MEMFVYKFFKEQDLPRNGLVLSCLLSLCLLLPLLTQGQACVATDYNVVANKQMITLSTTASTSGNINVIKDGNNSNNSFYYTGSNQTVAGKSYVYMSFPQAEVLQGFEIAVGAYLFKNGTVMEVQASNDQSTWTTLMSRTHTASTTPCSYGSCTTAEVYPFPDNTTAYQYYRLQGISGNSRSTPWINELYFTSIPAESTGLSDVNCDNNGTTGNTADDRITFQLNPTGGTGTYTVTAAGTTVTPSSASFGAATTFTLGAGTAGGGDRSITVSGYTAGCTVTETVTDPGPCFDTDQDGVPDNADLDDDNDGILDTEEAVLCTAVDYDILANKQTLIITKTASTGGTQSNNPGVLLDGNITAQNFYYNRTGIAGNELFRLQFPKPTILSGVEYYIGNSYMIEGGAQTVMQASDDGINWVDVSPIYTKAGNTNEPGALSGGPYAENFLWTNTTPYLYYRHLGISGRTNLNPWVYELYLRTEDFPICDTDGDGVVNRLDLDSDNDGIPDNVEGQPTTPYVAPANDTPAQYLANNGVNSAYGTGIATAEDTDGDLCPDFVDTDSDNDTVLDRDESGLTFNGVPGVNGLDSGSETSDDYTDPNGVVDNPLEDLLATSQAYYRQPSMALEAIEVTCNGAVPNSDGTLRITAVGETIARVGFSEGSLYTGPPWASATPVAPGLPITVTNTLANPTVDLPYSVRAYITETYYIDEVVTLNSRVCATAELSVMITPATASANAAEFVTYEVTLNNAGPDPGADVEVKVDIPSAVELLSAVPEIGSFNGGTEMWTIPSVPLGSHKLTITYKVQ